MRPEPRINSSLALILAFVPLLFASCQERKAFGMGEKRLAEILAAKDPSPILALDDRSLDDPGYFGPAGSYYLARWIEAREPKPPAAKPVSAPEADAGTAERLARGDVPLVPKGADPAEEVRRLLRSAYDHADGLVRIEAGKLLVQRLSDAQKWEELLALAADYGRTIGPDWSIERPRLEALEATGDNVELIRSTAALRADFPAEASADADSLLYFEGVAARRLERPGWPAPIRQLLLERPASAWTGKALDYLASLDPPASEFSQAERSAARMRALVRDRDYGPAYEAAMRAREFILSPLSSPFMIADAGKAFLYSHASKEGLARFSRLEAEAARKIVRAPDPASAARAARVAWTAAFYRARFYRALELWPEAVGAFMHAVELAPAPADIDAALWYEIEAQAKLALQKAKPAKPGSPAALRNELLARRSLLAALESASQLWKDPSQFADLADELVRDALRARDWYIVDHLSNSLARLASPSLGARCAYIATRAMELGLYPESSHSSGGSDPDAAPLRGRLATDRLATRYRAIMDDRTASLHYRALAAWRLGAEPQLLPPELPEPALPASLGQLEGFLAGFTGFGMADIAFSEAQSRFAALDRDSIRRISRDIAAAGRIDSSMRLILALMARTDWDPRLSDYELLYPRPFLSELRSIRPRPDVPEALVFGLIRSESYFSADAYSRAGAIGLAQLMPGTAAEIASGLGLSGYDLRSPKDNMRIGTAMFAELLGETEGRAFRSMMAYNAGRGRLKKWLGESGDLPDDLMIEALGIEETRQYCRNILQATVMYGEIYYGIPVAASVREIVEGKADEGK
jgi:soluble lytic murein transglycosylase